MSNNALDDGNAVVIAGNEMVISIVTSFLLVTSTLVVSARLGTKWVVAKGFYIDDGLALAALISYIASGVATCLMDKIGSWTDTEVLNGASKARFAKASYVADLFYILTIVLAKLSIIFFLHLITQVRTHRILNFTLSGFTALWGISSFIAAAVRCRAPDMWNVFGKCYNQAAFWYAFGSLNILTDVAFIMLPLYITLPLQMATSKKVIISISFSMRVLDIAATSAQLAYVSAPGNRGTTIRLWPWILTSQLIQCITIITACVPFLKQLLEAFPSGMYSNQKYISREASKVSTSANSRSHLAKYAVKGLSGGSSDTERGSGVQSDTVTQLTIESLVIEKA